MSSAIRLTEEEALKRVIELPEDHPPITYSPRPLSEYVVEYEGKLSGLGVHQGLVHNLGAWNLFWLTSDIMDVYLANETDTGNLPRTSTGLAVCIATAYQTVSLNGGGVGIGDLFSHVKPRLAYDILIEDPGYDDLVLTLAFKDLWRGIVLKRIKEFEQRTSNLVVGNFRCK